MPGTRMWMPVCPHQGNGRNLKVKDMAKKTIKKPAAIKKIEDLARKLMRMDNRIWHENKWQHGGMVRQQVIPI